jgi:hypothetical protein
MITLMTRLAGKTAGETIAAMMAILRRRSPLSSDQWRKMARPRMRGSITFDNETCFARHALLRGMLSATTFGMALEPVARSCLTLRCLCQLAEGRRRERQWSHPKMAPPQDRPRRPE